MVAEGGPPNPGAPPAGGGAAPPPLPPVDAPIDADAAAFAAIAAEASVPVLVDFWAPWCGPCKIAAPEIAALAREMAGNAVVVKVNTEEHPELASRFGVQAIPTFVVLRGGTVVTQRSGVAPRADMRRWLQGAV